MARLTPLRSICAVLLIYTLYLLIPFSKTLLYSPRGYELVGAPPGAGQLSTDMLYGGACSPFYTGVMENVTIVLKMGDGEVSTRLPTYFKRLNRCTQNILLFSDRKAEYNGSIIHDALANLHSAYRYKNKDFDLYNAIQRGDNSDEKSNEGWRLDKYKFLPMMERTQKLRPKSHWFVFLELDTYVNWDNMHRFLVLLDHKAPYYLGSPVWPPKKPIFAHGGTGFVLSIAALEKLVAHGKTFAQNSDLPGTHQFGMDMEKECCGDEVLASVLKASGVNLHGYWPMFNGEKPSTIRFGQEQWCEAILTLHHLGPDDFADLEQWEASILRTSSNPLTFEELFTHIEPYLRDRVEYWTNMSEDVTYTNDTTSKSFETCSAACIKDRKCLQFEHFGNTCRLGHNIRLGHHQADGGPRWTSGWMMERIHDFRASHSPCNGAHFVHPNP